MNIQTITKFVFAKLVLLMSLFLLSQTVFAAQEFTIVIKDHKFEPANLEVPVGEKIKLIIDNQDPSAEEFESHSLHREKIVAGNSKISIMVGPLKAGEYEFFGEFHEATAKGKIIAK